MMKLSKVAKGASLLIALQVFSRAVVTFFLNWQVLRSTHPEVNGIGNVQMQLLLTTILFLSRETFRRVSLRSEKSESVGVLQSDVNLGWISISIGTLLSALGCGFVLYKQNEPLEIVSRKEYVSVSLFFGFSAILELFSEPMFVVLQRGMQFKARVGIEGLAIILRAITTYYLIVWRTFGVLGFGMAQLVYSTTLLVGYLYVYSSQFPIRALLPKNITKVNWTLSASYGIQTMVKYVLQEGEKIVLVAVESAFDQGVYGLVVGLGSIVTRLLFQPVEEVTFIAAAKLAGSGKKDHVKSGLELLNTVLKVVLYFGLFALSFGPCFSHTVIDILYGIEWSKTEAPKVLAWYCLYVLACAANGVTEAFAHAVSSPQQLSWHSKMLGFTGGGYLLLCYFAVTFAGTVGLVLAGSISMIVRTSLSVYLIREFFLSHGHDLELMQLLPKPSSLIIVAISGAVSCSILYSSFGSVFYRVSIGGMMALAAALVVLFLIEAPFADSLRTLWKTKRD